jgi:hypothetical protein
VLRHATVVIAMMGFYLAADEPASSHGMLIVDGLLETLGAVGKPLMLVVRAGEHSGAAVLTGGRLVLSVVPTPTAVDARRLV